VIEGAAFCPAGFHFTQQLERAEHFGAGELAEVQPKIVVTLGAMLIELDGAASSGDSLLGDFGADIIVGGKFSPVEATLSKHPGDFDAIGLLGAPFFA